MELHALDIPEETSQLAGWLERHLVGPHLAELVAELSAVHTGVEKSESLERVLGASLAAVSERGLDAISHDALQNLLQQPRLLLELQERLLEEGGVYWQALLADSDELEKPFQQGRRQLQDQLAKRRERSPTILSTPWYRQPQWVSLLTAAAVTLVMLGIYQMTRPPQVTAIAWGWNRAEAIHSGVSSREYLQALAQSGQQWFNKRPDDATSLAQRIGELRQGCSRLILADHQPLSQEDRQWLIAKCREWAAKFDEQLVALEAGTETQRVLAAMDATVNKLVQALHNRATG